MAIVTITASITLSANDSVSNLISKTISDSSSGELIDYSTSFNVPTSLTSLITPVTPLQFVYIRNIGSTNVTITWTPTSGASAVVQTLTPGSYLLFGQNTTGQGVTAISAQAVTSATQIEYVFLG